MKPDEDPMPKAHVIASPPSARDMRSVKIIDSGCPRTVEIFGELKFVYEYLVERELLDQKLQQDFLFFIKIRGQIMVPRELARKLWDLLAADGWEPLNGKEGYSGKMRIF